MQNEKRMNIFMGTLVSLLAVLFVLALIFEEPRPNMPNVVVYSRVEDCVIYGVANMPNSEYTSYSRVMKCEGHSPVLLDRRSGGASGDALLGLYLANEMTRIK